MRPLSLAITSVLAVGCFQVEYGEPQGPSPPPPVGWDACGPEAGTAGCLPQGLEVGSSEGDVARNLVLEDGQGHGHCLYGLCGRVTLVAVGAGWCLSCRGEMPLLKRWYEELADDGYLVLYAVYQDDAGTPATASFVREWDEEYDPPFPVVADPGDRVRNSFSLAGQELPISVVLDRHLVIRLAAGNLEPEVLRGEIDRILAEE